MTQFYSKYLLPVFFFFALSAATAQVVSLPDPFFQHALLATQCVDTDGDGAYDSDADINNDGLIQLSEALLVKSLNVSSQQITSISGIEQFTNLEVLSFSGNHVASVDLQALTHLKKLYCGVNDLSTLNLQGLNELELVNCVHNTLADIQLQGLSKLQEISAGQNNLTAINLSGLSSLITLRLSKNQLLSLDLHESPDLDFLDCSYNQLTTLPLQGVAKIRYLVCGYNQLTALDVQGAPELLDLECAPNPIESLDLHHLAVLDQVILSYCQLTNINLEGCARISKLAINNNALQTLDVGDLYNLKDLNCNSNQLEYLNIKNGSKEIYYLGFGGNPNLKFICCDDNQVTDVLQKVAQAGLTGCVVGDYCNFTPGGPSYLLYGNVKYEAFNNACDSLSQPFNNLNFSVTESTGNTLYAIGFHGTYAIYLPPGDYTIHPALENTNYYDPQPAVFHLSLPNDTNLLHQNICITPNGVHYDLEMNLLPINIPRPGRPASYRLIYKNKGTAIGNGLVRFQFPEPLMDFISSSIAPDEVASGQLIWNFSDLYPSDSRIIDVVCRINSPLDTPAVNQGDLLSIAASVEIQEQDEVLVDNYASLRQIVRNSHDPNDKVCLEGDTIPGDFAGKYLHYLIRFENTGDLEAEDIMVKDLIDLSKFDISSLQLVNSSHPCNVRIRNGNEADFIFEGINLPYTEPDKYGFVAFKIKTKPNIAEGNLLKNQADIFFDFNLPVITNQTSTLVHTTVGAHEPQNVSSLLRVYPNPANEELYLDTEWPVDRVEIYDLQGRIIARQSLQINKVNIRLLHPSMYLIRCYGSLGTSEATFIKN